MKYFCCFARYKDTQTNEALEFFNTFRQAKEYIVRCCQKTGEFDMFGINVFDKKKDEYTHYYILKDEIFGLKSSPTIKDRS